MFRVTRNRAKTLRTSKNSSAGRRSAGEEKVKEDHGRKKILQENIKRKMARPLTRPISMVPVPVLNKPRDTSNKETEPNLISISEPLPLPDLDVIVPVQNLVPVDQTVVVPYIEEESQKLTKSADQEKNVQNCPHCPYKSRFAHHLLSHLRNHVTPTTTTKTTTQQAPTKVVKRSSSPIQCKIMGKIVCHIIPAPTRTTPKPKPPKPQLEKPFKCDRIGCDFSGSSSVQLTVHLRRHSDTGSSMRSRPRHPFKCRSCNCDQVQAGSSSSSSGHKNVKGRPKNDTAPRRGHKAEKIYKCNKCRFSTTNEKQLETHHSIRHKEPKVFLSQLQ